MVELKFGRTADSALQQIRERKYTWALEDYAGEILVVGVSYDREHKNKPHSCVIERLMK